MFWYRRRQNVKPNGLSGSPWLIGIWRFRPLVRMVSCAATLKAASPVASAKASANRVHRADAGRMGRWYNVLSWPSASSAAVIRHPGQDAFDALDELTPCRCRRQGAVFAGVIDVQPLLLAEGIGSAGVELSRLGQPADRRQQMGDE